MRDETRREVGVDWSAVRRAAVCGSCGMPVDTSGDGIGLPPVKTRAGWFCGPVCEQEAMGAGDPGDTFGRVLRAR